VKTRSASALSLRRKAISASAWGRTAWSSIGTRWSRIFRRSKPIPTGSAWRSWAGARTVSYTHLDVYKRQLLLPLLYAQTGVPVSLNCIRTAGLAGYSTKSRRVIVGRPSPEPSSGAPLPGERRNTGPLGSLSVERSLRWFWIDSKRPRTSAYSEVLTLSLIHICSASAASFGPSPGSADSIPNNPRCRARSPGPPGAGCAGRPCRSTPD